jgi:hypothetical protein
LEEEPGDDKSRAVRAGDKGKKKWDKILNCYKLQE